VSGNHWRKYPLVYWAMETKILDMYDLNPFLTDQEVIAVLKDARKIILRKTRGRITPLSPEPYTTS